LRNQFFLIFSSPHDWVHPVLRPSP
jgi:hypothetical protein